MAVLCADQSLEAIADVWALTMVKEKHWPMKAPGRASGIASRSMMDVRRLPIRKGATRLIEHNQFSRINIVNGTCLVAYIRLNNHGPNLLIGFFERDYE